MATDAHGIERVSDFFASDGTKVAASVALVVPVEVLDRLIRGWRLEADNDRRDGYPELAAMRRLCACELAELVRTHLR